MKESIGGAWLFQIAIVFILLFAGYLALSVNYSRAFKVKNEIISIIERNEGATTKTQDEITKYLSKVNHTIMGPCDTADKEFPFSAGNNYSKGVYCLKMICDNTATIPRAYYKVKVFFRFDLPILGDLATFKVVGETKMIHNNQQNGLQC